ncbi:MAG: PIN domain-containing protein [Candidatus Micrarchaeia archaeon]|jgi:hypothetical protein
MSYFFDSYAIIEIMVGNPAFDKYKTERLITTEICFAETYYALLRMNWPDVRSVLSYLKADIIEPTRNDWFTAMEYRMSRKADRISPADALGYTLSRKNGLKFLTGDEKFKDIPGVEYLKK